jgi:diacylglycerol kinase family enzyme
VDRRALVVAEPEGPGFMKIIILLNRKAGALAAASTDPSALAETFAIYGLQARVSSVPARDLPEHVRKALAENPSAVVAGGGDGTISSVAGALAHSGVPLGVLPLGTLNHFARDLGMPQNLDDAVRAIAEDLNRGRSAAVDLASVNDHTFVNNSSIGIYPHVVRNREEQRQRLGRGKWLAMFFAILSALRRFPVITVRLMLPSPPGPHRSVLRRTPFVFVGNNPYDVSLFTVGSRKSLDQGKLCLYVANRPGRFAMVLLAVRAILGRLDQARDFDAETLDELWVETPKRHLHVALDGEVVTLSPPLHYQSMPKALKVVGTKRVVRGEG